MTDTTKNKNHRGSASQFFVAGELCRRGLVAVVTIDWVRGCNSEAKYELIRLRKFLALPT